MCVYRPYAYNLEMVTVAVEYLFNTPNLEFVQRSRLLAAAHFFAKFVAQSNWSCY